jgi:hypothetical protein
VNVVSQIAIQSGRESWLDDAAATTPQRAGATARIDGGDMSAQAELSKLPVTLLTKRAYVDLLRTASAACRYNTAR